MLHVYQSMVKRVNNNSAQVGPFIYGGRVDKCTSNNKEHIMSSFLDSVVVDNSSYNYTSYTLTSAAIKLCYCWDHIPDCNLHNLSRTLFPGQALEVEVACVDQIEQPVPCNIQSDFDMINIELGQPDQYCQNLNFHIFSKHNNTSALLSLKAGLYCSESTRNTVDVNISIMPCPVGFQNVKNRCVCDNRLNKTFDGITCDIKSNSKVLKHLGWFSYYDGYLKAHQNSPLNYCSNRKNISANNFDSQCENNHEGILCSKCVTNHSVVLGSWKCMKCLHLSNI